MQGDWLPVSHIQQTNDGDCLPVCVEMVLRYWNLSVNPRRLRRTLGTRWFGTPFENVHNLAGVKVMTEHLLLPQLRSYLERSIPVIPGIRTGELGYWNEEDTDHAVVVLGVDAGIAIVNDPILPFGHQQIPISELELARIAFDDLCAVVTPK